jgi:hypothetical protein
MRIGRWDEVDVARMHLEGIDGAARANDGHASSALSDVSHLSGLGVPVKLAHALMCEIYRVHSDVFENGPEL